MQTRTRFELNEMARFETTSKIALLATVTPDGLPHITMISTLQALTETEMVWGQFSYGLSKQHVRNNPRTAFLFLTLDKKLWRGQATYTRFAQNGPEYDMFNQKPLFRYNTYFGINTVYYMDLKNIQGPESLPLASIIPSAILTSLGKGGLKAGTVHQALNPWTCKLLDSMDSLTFLASIGEDGYPGFIPIIQAQSAGTGRIAFNPLAYGNELKKLAPGQPVALYTMNQALENVLTRGVYRGVSRSRGIALGHVDIDWVYNSMPPKQGQIYPMPPMQPVKDF
jgi:predicted pyridoxine 5'-phosphate oxidase superfamily flavin-nucleotide-binding protein